MPPLCILFRLNWAKRAHETMRLNFIDETCNIQDGSNWELVSATSVPVSPGVLPIFPGRRLVVSEEL